MDYVPSEPISPIGVDDIDDAHGPTRDTSLPFWAPAFGPPTTASAAAFLRLPPEVILR